MRSELDRERAKPRLQRAFGGEIGDVVLVRARDSRVAERDDRTLRGDELGGQRADQKQRSHRMHGERSLEILAAQSSNGVRGNGPQARITLSIPP